MFYSPVSKEFRFLIPLLASQMYYKQWWKCEDQSIFRVSAAVLREEQVICVLWLPVPVRKHSGHLKDFNCCSSAEFLTLTRNNHCYSNIFWITEQKPLYSAKWWDTAPWSTANNQKAGITGSLGHEVCWGITLEGQNSALQNSSVKPNENLFSE